MSNSIEYYISLIINIIYLFFYSIKIIIYSLLYLYKKIPFCFIIYVKFKNPQKRKIKTLKLLKFITIFKTLLFPGKQKSFRIIFST